MGFCSQEEQQGLDGGGPMQIPVGEELQELVLSKGAGLGCALGSFKWVVCQAWRGGGGGGGRGGGVGGLRRFFQRTCVGLWIFGVGGIASTQHKEKLYVQV